MSSATTPNDNSGGTPASASPNPPAHKPTDDSSEPLSKIQTELAVLIVGLDTVETVSLVSGSSDVDTSIEKELKGCDEVLFALRRFHRQHHAIWPPQAGPELTNDALKELVEIQERLEVYSKALNTHNVNIIRSSQEHVERTMKAFIEEVRSGKREQSVISTKALSADEKEGWKQLRKELQDAGINSECFTQNFDMIYAALKEFDVGGNLPQLEDIPPDTIRSSQDGLLSYGHVRDLATNMASAWMNQISGFTYTSPRWNSISKQSRQALSGLKVQPTHVSHMVSKAMGNRVDLVSCAEDGDLTSVLNLLKRGASINTTAEGGETALSQAAANGHKEIVLLLFAKGADLDLVNQQGETAFIQAAKNGHQEIVQILLSHAESVANGRFGTDALKKAAENGHAEIVRMLLERGVDADVLDSDDQSDNTPLSRAASNGHEAVVIMLLNHGVRINIANYWGETALYHAVAFGDRRVIHHLLKFEVDIDPRAEHRARENGRLFGWLKAEQEAREKGLIGNTSPTSPKSPPRRGHDRMKSEAGRLWDSAWGRPPGGWSGRARVSASDTVSESAKASEQTSN
ncbi:hypothetical protein N7533_003813 [Penicillium manginii]|uniref:uncharacterized protein n=1 Tax=Penicillium manginii TaxID=203109 RepID=UPI0025479D90|nr:uncharacterized protein N7533_003813 [Penicillium manginii]KAJ5754270.1 hypothetical protein N7533_003813 [Penicillium manginii]